MADITDEDGEVAEEAIRWESDLNGFLGTGEDVAISGLKEGTHTIRVTADDGRGGMAADEITVRIVRDPTALPATPSRVTASPSMLQCDPSEQLMQHDVVVEDENYMLPAKVFRATASEPWVKLMPVPRGQDVRVSAPYGAMSVAGLTPFSLRVTCEGVGNVSQGIHSAVVTIDLVPSGRLTVPVTLRTT
ncbi:MAG TPA: hypothetical protein VM841_09755 [Actinomycetota bacterium]|nr:hypothetical protein [Actinomycetota bacterium]